MMKEKENRKKQLGKKNRKDTPKNTTKKNHARKKYHNINKCIL